MRSAVRVDEGGQHSWGPQLVWIKSSVHHVPQAEAEPEPMVGTGVVNSDSRLTPSFEYSIVAKSRVMSTHVIAVSGVTGERNPRIVVAFRVRFEDGF